MDTEITKYMRSGIYQKNFTNPMFQVSQIWNMLIRVISQTLKNRLIYNLSEQFGIIRSDWSSLGVLLLGRTENVSEVIARIGSDIPFWW